MDFKFNPTPFIFLTLATAFVLNIIAGLWVGMQYWYVLVLLGCIQTVIVIASFTPLHEAVHRVASSNRWLNEAILFLSGPIFLSSPLIFRKIHLAHHARTNQEDRDPDHFVSGNHWTERWIRSFFLIVYYHIFYFHNFMRTRGERSILYSSLSILGITLLGMLISGYLPVFFLVWIAPTIAGIGFLAFLNTAWPHHPGRAVNKYQNTKILLIPRPLEWLMMEQNLHLIHHLRPTLRWYQYRAYWEDNREELAAKGAEVLDYRITTRKILSVLDKLGA
jgi:fatty acid desaturase